MSLFGGDKKFIEDRAFGYPLGDCDTPQLKLKAFLDALSLALKHTETCPEGFTATP